MSISKIKKTVKLKVIPLAPMGVLAPGSAHARPSARPPIDTSGNFQAHVSAEQLFEISLFSGQNRVILGGRGGPRNFFCH